MTRLAWLDRLPVAHMTPEQYRARDAQIAALPRIRGVPEWLAPTETLRQLVRHARTAIGSGVVRAEVWVT